MNSTERNGSEPPTLGAACSSVTGLQRIPLLAPSHAIGNMSLTQIVKISRFGVNRGQRGHPFSSRNSTHWRSQLPRDLQMVPPLLRRARPNKSGLHSRSCPGGCPRRRGWRPVSWNASMSASNKFRKLYFTPAAWLSCLSTSDGVMAFTEGEWQNWFCSFLGPCTQVVGRPNPLSSARSGAPTCLAPSFMVPRLQ